MTETDPSMVALPKFIHRWLPRGFVVIIGSYTKILCKKVHIIYVIFSIDDNDCVTCDAINWMRQNRRKSSQLFFYNYKNCSIDWKKIIITKMAHLLVSKIRLSFKMSRSNVRYSIWITAYMRTTRLIALINKCTETKNSKQKYRKIVFYKK